VLFDDQSHIQGRKRSYYEGLNNISLASNLSRDMKSLVTPVNFSVNSHNAARYAADLAELVGADIHLLHVLQIPLTNIDVPTTEYIMGELQTAAEESLNELKQELVKRTCGKVQDTLQWKLGE